LSDFKQIRLTFDLEHPYQSMVEIDGHIVTNAFAAKVEQIGPLDAPTVELQGLFADEPLMTPNPPRVVWHRLCHHCYKPLAEADL
jgi:hypothetical protein